MTGRSGYQKFRVGYFRFLKFRVFKITTRNSLKIFKTRKFGYPTFRVRVPNYQLCKPSGVFFSHLPGLPGTASAAPDQKRRPRRARAPTWRRIVRDAHDHLRPRPEAEACGGGVVGGRDEGDLRAGAQAAGRDRRPAPPCQRRVLLLALDVRHLLMGNLI